MVNLEALIDSVGDDRLSPRFVRYLIAEGILPPARGIRSNPDYGDDHVQRARGYFFLRDRGLSVEQVRLLVAGEAAGVLPLPLAPGVVLHIQPEVLHPPPDPEALAGLVHHALSLIQAMPDAEHPDADNPA